MNIFRVCVCVFEKKRENMVSLNGDNQGFRYFSAHITVMDEFIVTVYYAKRKGKRVQVSGK